MKNFIYLNLLIITLLFTSCASRYNYLNPEAASFSSSNDNDKIKLSYEYLRLIKKYAKKADKKDIRIASVKIENNTDKPITYDKDFKLVSDSNDYLPVLNGDDLYEGIKQKPGTHFWYLLLAPIQLNKTETNSNGFTETKPIFPIGLLLAPAISLGNFFTAKKANGKFEDEIKKYSIYNKTINPGETKVFLVPLRHSNYPSLKAKLN